MTKFGHYLDRTSVPEWSDWYIDYRALKRILSGFAMDDSSQSLSASPGHHDDDAKQLAFGVRDDDKKDSSMSAWADWVPDVAAFRPLERAFFQRLALELAKIDEFYARQQAYFEQQVAQLEAAAAQRHASAGHVDAHHLRHNTIQLYRGLQFLRNYQILNYTGFHKILKKHDKLSTSCRALSARILPEIERAPFHQQAPAVLALTARVEQVHLNAYGRTLETRKTALAELRESTAVHPAPRPAAIFGCGVLMGVSACLLATALLTYTQLSEPLVNDYLAPVLPIYRVVGLLIMLPWLWGAVAWACQRARVNYGFILETDVRTQLHPIQVWQLAGALTLLGILSFQLYMLGIWLSLFGAPSRARFCHLALLLALIGMAVWPLNCVSRASRSFLLHKCAHTVAAPWTEVSFADTFLGDWLTSMVRVLVDLCFWCCFEMVDGMAADALVARDRCTAFVSGAQWVVCVLPYWWRMCQCVKRYYRLRHRVHLANAAKYATATLVTLLNLLHGTWPHSTVFLALWVLAAIVGTLVLSAWDLHWDWGLLQRHSGDFLRPHLLLAQHKWVYYVAAVSDVLMRTAWVLTISPRFLGATVPNGFLVSALAAVELVRRAQWSFFRLENEHVSNCEHFRVVTVVPLI